MTLIDVLLIILILLASSLCIFIIFSLRKLLIRVEAVSTDIQKFLEKANPILDNLADVSQRANRIVTEAENYWDELDSSIKKLKQKVSDITSLNIFKDVEHPAKDLIRNLKAFSKGISAFWQAFKRN
jgi:ABC-type transporter Mla subunit MlaD